MSLPGSMLSTNIETSANTKYAWRRTHDSPKMAERESERKNNFSVKVNIFSTAFQFLWDAAFFSLYIYATAATAVVGWHIARMLLLLRFGWTNNRPKDPHAHQHIFYRASNIHWKYICTSINIYSLDDYSDSTNQQQYKESDGIRRRE